MACPLCRKRPTRRLCPAKREEICTVCCATKRLAEIACPEDCRYLQTAQRHPPAVVKKQIDHDVTVLMASIGRLSEPQLQVFFLVQSMVLAYRPEGLSRLTDSDVALAAGALAASFETASKGVIFEEATSSVPAEGLRKTLKPVLEEITSNGGSRAQREVAVVMRAIERGAKHEGGFIPDGETVYLELVGRVFQQRPKSPDGGPGDGGKPLIVTP